MDNLIPFPQKVVPVGAQKAPLTMEQELVIGLLRGLRAIAQEHALTIAAALPALPKRRRWFWL